ncbi:DUF4381 domain-containing protein [Microbulbifer hydrolyticus]|uniref:DUF4381 family protein n=1 Tax=Microbulbifer hydrolyticus TaxID=48074 RepID=A0A6P1TAC2_9GAMM|nr:DUF4381 domain-containing protein [Microbulbifer hydrolyticus]MBB5210848.1 hypothetical protein [Microbulbifer hydrolyticus]QHQ38721.1 DUF4381 family protein [Microbulbifer hydrolyticus]
MAQTEPGTAANTETTLPDLIAQLVPPPVPEAISLWPQTPLARSLLAGVLLLAIYLAWRTWRHYRKNAYRRAALNTLRTVENNPGAIAELLRRTALAVYPRQQVAGLTGAAWLAFLNRQYPGDEFRGDVGEALLRGAYTACPPNAALAAAARHWIRTHKATIEPSADDSAAQKGAPEVSP